MRPARSLVDRPSLGATVSRVLPMRRWFALAAWLVSTWSQGVAQTHMHPACGGEYHYRWGQKVDTSLQTGTPEPVTIAKMPRSVFPTALKHASARSGPAANGS